MTNVYIIAFSDAEFLHLQHLTFKKFFKGKHRLICINNSFDNRTQRKEIREKADELSIEHVIPKDVNHSQAGFSHQTALNWTWKKFIAGNNHDSSIIVDHDMFPIRPFEIDPDYDITGIMQGRGQHIKYFHPGLMMINSLKDKHTVDFKGEVIDGHPCDSGGNWHRYLEAHPDLRVKALSLVNISVEQGNLDVLPESVKDNYNEVNPFQICEDFMFHFRAGSNWCQDPLHETKKQQLREVLNYYTR